MRAIADARIVMLLMTGAAKRKAFESFAGDGPAESAPVRAILRARSDLWACWAP
jgi:6-phosphogluconolactonase/glucosamine-6-phosphate isomerase/deaminase